MTVTGVASAASPTLAGDTDSSTDFDAVSLSMMAPTARLLPSTAPAGFTITTAKVSSPSSTMSSTVTTSNVTDVSPAGTVAIPSTAGSTAT